MVLYRCDKCGYSTKHKETYKRHLNRKNPCSLEDMNMVSSMEKTSKPSKFPPYNSDVPPNSLHITPTSLQKKEKMDDNISQDLDCIYCGKKFTRKDNLSRHLKNRCVVLRNYMEKESNDTEELRKKVEKLEKITDNISTITNNNDNSTNNTDSYNNTLNQQININCFGKENTSYITGDIVNKYLEYPYTAMENLLKDIHFNSEHPENQNIKMTNIHDSYAKIYKDDKWLLASKSGTIDKMMIKARKILDNYREEDNHSDFKNNCYDDIMYRLNNEDKEIVRDMGQKLVLMVLNNSNV